MSEEVTYEEFRDLIPEDALPGVAVRIVTYFDQDGNELTSYAIHGNTAQHTVLGLLELVKFRMVDEWEEITEDDE